MVEQALHRSVSVGVTSVEVMPESKTRRYAIFCNQSSNVIYLQFGVNVAATEGVRLNANGGAYEINLTNPYHGRIYAIASGASSTLSMVEW